MVKTVTLFLFFSIFFFGCKGPTKHSGVIREEVFVNVLADIHLADGIIAVNGYRTTVDTVQINGIYNSVFEKYGVTQKNFKTTMEYYSEHTAEYDLLYDKVMTKLSEKESKIDLARTKSEQ